MTTDAYDMGPQDTEWDDALRKHKILPKKPKKVTEDQIDTKIMWEKKEADPYAGKTLADLDEMEDDIEEDTLRELRHQRLAELQAKAQGDKFGRVQQIGKPEYTQEVTEASKEQPVICCLFVHGQEDSKMMLQCLEKLAAKFKTVKFTKIVGQECIPNYKDSFCPTLVIYKDGDPVGNIKGLLPFGGKKVVNADIVEWELANSTGVWKTSLEEDPRKFKLKKIGGSGGKKYTIVKKGGDDADDGDDSDSDLDLD